MRCRSCSEAESDGHGDLRWRTGKRRIEDQPVYGPRGGPAELTKLLQLDESTLSRNVERMYAKGWLRLETGEDRRSHLIEVTEKGQALLRKCLPAWQQAQENVTKRLGAKTVAALKSAIRRLPG